MEKKEISAEERVSKLVNSLELITARMLEITTMNNQIATSQTPEMRKLFDKWIECLSSEILCNVGENENINIDKIAANAGISRSSALSLLLAMERRGVISITGITAVKGDGKNSDICDCLLS